MVQNIKSFSLYTSLNVKCL